MLVLSPACHKAADLIAESGVPVVLEGTMDVRRDPVTGEEIETFVPAVFAEKGIRFALSSASPTQSLWYQAALCVGNGLDRQTAMDAVTRTPAEILGMGNDVGSLEVGKHGNVVLYSGDPMSVTSWVDRVVIEGREVYDRADDLRNKHLLEGAQPRNTGPTGVEEVKHEHNEEHGDEHDDEGDDD